MIDPTTFDFDSFDTAYPEQPSNTLKTFIGLSIIGIAIGIFFFHHYKNNALNYGE